MSDKSTRTVIGIDGRPEEIPEKYMDAVSRLNLTAAERRFNARTPLSRDALYLVCDLVEKHRVPYMAKQLGKTITLSIDDYDNVTIPDALYVHARYHLDELEGKSPPGQREKYNWKRIPMIAADVASEWYGKDADVIRSEVQRRYVERFNQLLPNNAKLREVIAEAMAYVEEYRQEAE